MHEIYINMWRNIKEDKEVEIIAQNTLSSIVKLIYAWKQSNFINSVILENGDKINSNENNVCEWISDIRVIEVEKC